MSNLFRVIAGASITAISPIRLYLRAPYYPPKITQKTESEESDQPDPTQESEDEPCEADGGVIRKCVESDENYSTQRTQYNDASRTLLNLRGVLPLAAISGR